MEKTIAVVVTYNREKLLAECIEALRSQTTPPDSILVVNNGSTDNTENWLRQQNDLTFITQNNDGSGGGFSTGIQWAYENGYSWIWCMDDDGYPKKDAFENLLKAGDSNELRLLNCIVVDKQDKNTLVWKTGQYSSLREVDCDIIQGKGHPFNGTLIHRRIVERVGMPQKKFFLWGDETEYYYRITRKNKIPVATVANSIHYHPASAFSVKQDWDFTTSWKMYYYVRNRLAIHKAKFNSGVLAYMNYLSFIVAFAGVIVLFQKTDKIKKLSFLFWPAKDAFLNRFGATPPDILKNLSVQTNHSYISQFKFSVQNVLFRLFSAPTFHPGNKSEPAV